MRSSYFGIPLFGLGLSTLGWFQLGCSVRPEDAGARARAAEPAAAANVAANRPVLQGTIQADASREVVVTALPNAACRVFGQGKSASDGLAVYSDETGDISFQASPSATDVVGALQLDCVDERGTSAKYQVQLTTATSPVRHSPKGIYRPGLEGDPNALSDAQLVARGFPPRPGAGSSPAACEQWLRLVRQPATRVTPRLIPTQHRNDVNTDIWAGYSTTSTGTYSQISGRWTVPTVTGEAQRTDYSSMWVALNTNSTGLWQAGSEHEVSTSKVIWRDPRRPSLTISLSNTYAFYELLPAGATQLTAPTVIPGQQLYVSLWIGDSSGTVNISGGFAWYHILNVTTSLFAQGSVPTAGTNTNYVSAIWIAERPKTHAVEPPYNHLANFGTLNIDQAYAGAGNGLLPHSSLASVPIAMVEPSTGHLLAQAYADSSKSDALQIVWRNFY